MSELGNLTEGIFLSPEEMSTVKIRAGSLFCTPRSRTGAKGEAFDSAGVGKARFPHRSTARRRLHSLCTELPSLRLAATRGLGAKSEETVFEERFRLSEDG